MDQLHQRNDLKTALIDVRTIPIALTDAGESWMASALRYGRETIPSEFH